MEWWKALGLDLVWVLLFAVIGRLSHGESADPFGLLVTAWPFWVALVGVTVALIGMKRPTEKLLNAAILWAGTMIFGLWIRSNAGATVEVSFAIVAGVFLAIGMIGWRIIVAFRA